MLLKFLSAKFPMIHTPKPLSDSGKGLGDKKNRNRVLNMSHRNISWALRG
jgi:hypothetical protein